MKFGQAGIFFRVMHVVIDAHGGDLPDRVPPVAYLNYVLNFTSLVSGPIQRYPDYAATQLQADRPPLDWLIAGRACERIVIGLFKVVVLAAILYALYRRSLAEFAEQAGFAGHVLTALEIAVGYTVGGEAGGSDRHAGAHAGQRLPGEHRRGKVAPCPRTTDRPRPHGWR